MSPPRRLVTAERRDDDVADASLRPQRLSEFIGQQQARANLSVFIAAAGVRKEALDHVLFVGPPGLGKTTLAQIVARELGVNFRATSGPVIAKAGDLAALDGDQPARGGGHLLNSFNPCRINCAVSAFSPMPREAAAIAAAACGWP